MLKRFLQDSSISNHSLKFIFNYIHEHGPISQADLIKQTNLNRSKVSRSINELEKNGYIRICGYEESTGGRPPVLYQINSTACYIIGVQISRMYTQVVLFDLQYNDIEQYSFSMTSEHTPKAVILQIKEAIDFFMKKYQFNVDHLLGIGIGTVGTIDKQNGIIVSTNPFLSPEWTDVSIVKEIKEFYPVRIILENGANLAVLGEYKHLDFAYQDILYCISAWAWGCGVITNGKLKSFKSGDVTKYGHMVIDESGNMCSCGKKGCVVSYTSIDALLEEVRNVCPLLYDSKLPNNQYASLEDVLSLLLTENPAISEIVMKSAYYYGLGLANLVNVLQPELVIVGGPLINHYPNYYKRVAEVAREFIHEAMDVKFAKEDFNRKSVVVGAAVCVFDTFR